MSGKAPTPTSGSTLSSLLSLVFLVGLSGAFLAVSVWMMYPAYEVGGWSTAKCEIVDTGVRQGPLDNDDVWTPKVSWRYRVAGTQYERIDDDPASFGRAYGRGEAQDVADRYKVGDEIPCYYEPGNPSRSKLDRNAPPWTAFLFSGVALTAVLASLAVLVMRLRSRLSGS